MLELSPANVLGYLRDRGQIGPEPAQVEPLGWGVSNLVLRIRTLGRVFVLKQSRPQLRTRDPWFSDLERVYREQEVMQVLRPLLPAGVVPEVLFVDRPNYVFAMSHAPEDAVVWKETLLLGNVHLGLGEWTGRVLGMMHETTAYNPLLIEPFRDHTVFVQLRVEPFYQRILERRPEVAKPVRAIIDRMLSLKLALCHGDYSPKNILVHQFLGTSNGKEGEGNGFTLVDYETAHFGDPTMDLGFFLSHLILKGVKRHSERDRYFDLTRAFWRGYAREVRFQSMAELQPHGIAHFAICALARIDGTSPVDYLPEEPKRETVRAFTRQILHDRLETWEEVLNICDLTMSKL